MSAAACMPNHQQLLQAFSQLSPESTVPQCRNSMQGLQAVPWQRSRGEIAVPVLSCAKHAPAMAPLQVGMDMAEHTLSRTVHLPKCAQTMGRMAAYAAASAATTAAQALPGAHPAEGTGASSRWPPRGPPSSCTAMRTAGSLSLLALLEGWRCALMARARIKLSAVIITPSAQRTHPEVAVYRDAQQSEV